jgi:membrane-anchored protein YejM (alkaline phosphatase superfamily)
MFPLKVTLAAALFQALVLCALVFFPDPGGFAITEHIDRFLPFILGSSLGSIFLIASPFALWSALKPRSAAPGRALAIALGLYCAVCAIDAEVFRYMRQHLSLSFLSIYLRPSNLLDPITWSLLRSDPLGMGGTLVLVFATTATGVGAAIRHKARETSKTAQIVPPCVFAVLGIAFYLSPWWWHASTTRRPLILSPLHMAVQEVLLYQEERAAGMEINTQALRAFLPQDFLPASEDFPVYNKKVNLTYKSTKEYNVVLFIGESFKGNVFSQMFWQNDSLLMPHLLRLSQKGGVWFSHAYAGGYPTINGTGSIFLGLPGHPDRSVFQSFTANHLTGFPELLPENYRKAHISVYDPGFDNQTPWLNRFYGTHWKALNANPAFNEAAIDDSLTMNLVLDTLASFPSDAPWFLHYTSFSTHMPFIWPSSFLPQADLPPLERYKNALRWTDAQFGRLLESLEARPDWERTVVIVLGDHSVPVEESEFQGDALIEAQAHTFIGIFSPDSALFGGILQERADVASQLDIAPTVMDLTGSRHGNHFWGYDLLAQERPQGQPALFLSSGNYALGFADTVLAGPLSAPPSGDSLSVYWRTQAIAAAKSLRALLRHDRMEPSP